MGRVLGCLLVILLAGCATPKPEVSGDPAGEAQALLDAGRAAGALNVLEAVERRDGAAELVLGDVCRRLGREEDGLSAYWRARDAAVPSVRCQANLRLGEVALGRQDPYLARARFDDAEGDAESVALLARVHVGQARSGLARGEAEKARALRAGVALSEVRGLVALDTELGLLAEAARSAGAVEESVSESVEPAEEAPVLVPSPGILTRRAWRARPVRARGNPEPMGGVSRITLHHTATKRLPAASEVSNAALLRALQSDHQNGRRWADIGYHFVIDRQGRVWEGRELRWQGAHAGSRAANRHNIGVALVGNFDRYPPSAAQKASLTALVRWLCSANDISPDQIRGHGQVLKAHTGSGTACPGRHLSRYITSLRSAVQADRVSVPGL